MCPFSQTHTTYMPATMQANNLAAVGSIPRAWLKEEKWRLHTYAKYPLGATKSAILLAENGFVYIGSGKDSDDTVVCIFCNGMKRAWREDEDIFETHRALNRDCAMVTDSRNGNIPLIQQPRGDGSFQQLPQNRVSSQRATNNPEAPVPFATQTVVAPSATAEPPTPAVVSNSTTPGAGTVQSSTPTDVTPSSTSPSSEPLPAATAPATHSSISTYDTNPPSIPPVPTQSSTSTSTTAPQPPCPTPAIESATSTTPEPPCSTPSPTNQPPTATQSSTSSPPNQSSSSETAPAAAGTRTPTYQDLGIITERPKRYEYALRSRRLETFGEWPCDHHLNKEDLADAGFYYAGYGDCARCFFCGGGLRNWEQEDDVWVEHARWFSKCAFMRQKLGQAFIDTVALLAQTNDTITFPMVVQKMGVDPAAFQIDSKENPLKADAAVIAVCTLGYQEADVIPVAEAIKESGQVLAADVLYTALEKAGVARQPVNINVEESKNFRTIHRDVKKDEALLNHLKETNHELRMQTQCKICMDREVAVVFLPCGHLVCCTECASAMKNCPVCRVQVKGSVRAFIS